MLKHAPSAMRPPLKSAKHSVSAVLWRFWMITTAFMSPARRCTVPFDWIKDIYTPDMNKKYVYPNVFMSTEDTEQVSNLQADLQTYMNTQKAN